ncbi:MAG: hypothetical protein KGZ63_06325 [Clostridiales bacterium]|nr:hypothetical protein [Clostridiales bacterium]
MKEYNYTIIYVMPQGSRLGLHKKMNEAYSEQYIKDLIEKGCIVEKVEKEECYAVV